MTEREWADYLSVVLKQLERLAHQPPKEVVHASHLKKLVEEACEPLARLVGYLL